MENIVAQNPYLCKTYTRTIKRLFFLGRVPIMGKYKDGTKDQVITAVVVAVYLAFVGGYGVTVFKIDSWTKPAEKTALIQTE